MVSKMADQPKTYAVGISAKQKTFSSGTSIIKLGVNVKKFVAFLNEHVNEAGYVNLGVSERREVGQYGETHSVWLDTWKPDGEKPKQRDAVAEDPPAHGEAVAKAQKDDLPF